VSASVSSGFRFTGSRFKPHRNIGRVRRPYFDDSPLSDMDLQRPPAKNASLRFLWRVLSAVFANANETLTDREHARSGLFRGRDPDILAYPHNQIKNY
jgi:hypothetical protein